MKSTLPIEVISSVDGGGGGGGNFWSFVDFVISSVQIKQHKDIIVSKYWENCVFPMQIYETFSSFGPLAFISKLFFVGIVIICITKQIRRKSAKISARSLRSLAIIDVFFSSFCFSGRNKSSWTRPYHECYEHKDIIYCTDKPCDLSTEYWGESYVSDPKIPQISARSQYSFFISFWFSGRLKKTYTFLTQSRKSAKNFGSLALLAHNH